MSLPAQPAGYADRPPGSMRGGAAWLFLPGANERFVKRALAAPPDAIVLDLEDGLDPGDLDAARHRIPAAAEACAGRVAVWLRTHPAGHPEFLADVASAWGPHLDGVVLPKAASRADVLHAEHTILSHERSAGSARRAWSIVPMVESSRALENLGDVLRASARVTGVALGAEDLASDLGLPAPSPHDPEGCAARESVLDAVRVRIMMTAAASGIVVRLDAPPLQWDDGEALAREARRTRAMGFTGRLLIHPAQIGPTRRGFAPTPAEVRWARAVLEAADARGAAGIGGGAWRFEGTMVDEAVLRQARAVAASEEA